VTNVKPIQALFTPMADIKGHITGRGRQKHRVRARDLLCYWTVVELGMPMVDLARKFDPNVVKVENATDPRRPRVTL